jgi:hypothetical protein
VRFHPSSPQLVAALPDGVDAFGECGEFHTLAQVWLAVDSALAVRDTSLAKVCFNAAVLGVPIGLLDV